jgi:hypothetical protein
MANKQTTSWVLEFIDEITKPMKNAVNSISKATNFIEDMTSAVNFNEKETKSALSNSKKYYSELEQQIKDTEKEIKALEKAKNSDSWNDVMKASKGYEKATEKLKDLRSALQGAENDIKDLTNQSEKFSNKAQKWTDVTTGINQATELMQKAVNGLDFTVDVGKLRTEIARMTDLSGKDLDNFVYKSRQIGTVYNQDSLEIARAANALTKQVGGSFDENLALIESGLKRGANSNGDFIDQLKEYPTFIDQLGISQSKAIAFMAKAGKEGIFSDKAIDSLKEAGLALNEMGKPQKDALKGVGIDYDKDLKGKSQFEAIEFIAQNMKGATAQARQMIISDIFKGAGEDAGNKLFEILSKGVPNLEDMPAVEEAGSGMKSFFSDLQSWAGLTFGSIGSYAQELAPMVMTVSGMIPIMQMLSNSTRIQTAAQWLLNIAMNANPIGLIILGIAALVGLVAIVIKKYDEWGAAVSFLMGPLGWIINLVQSFRRHWDSIVQAFKSEGIIGGLKRIGIVILDALLMPIQQLLELIAKIPGMKGIAGGAADWIKQQRQSLNLITPEEKEVKKSDSKTASKPSVNDYALGNKKLGEIDKTTDATGTKKGNQIEVGSGSNGIKSIVMNLTVNNSFNTSRDTNTRDLADKITSEINDRLRDGIISVG